MITQSLTEIHLSSVKAEQGNMEPFLSGFTLINAASSTFMFLQLWSCILMTHYSYATVPCTSHRSLPMEISTIMHSSGMHWLLWVILWISWCVCGGDLLKCDFRSQECRSKFWVGELFLGKKSTSGEETPLLLQTWRDYCSQGRKGFFCRQGVSRFKNCKFHCSYHWVEKERGTEGAPLHKCQSVCPSTSLCFLVTMVWAVLLCAASAWWLESLKPRPQYIHPFWRRSHCFLSLWQNSD